MAVNWIIEWYTCVADAADAAFNAQERKKGREERVIKAGDALWRSPLSIGPIGTDHSHWGGTHLTLGEAQAEWVARACQAYEEAGHPFPPMEG